MTDLNPPVRADLLAALDTELSFLPMDSIGENGSLNLERTRPIAEVRNGYSYFEDGDVAFAKVTPCFENGKGALMQGLENGAGFGTTEITVLRPKTGTNARYLRYIVQSEMFRQLGVGAMTGAGGLKRVPDDFTRDFKTDWPGAVDQERIANFLDDKTARIDALIAEKERLLSLLGESRESVTELAVMPTDGTPLKPLKRVTLRIITGPFGSALHSSEYVEDGVPVINPSHIVGNSVCPDRNVSVTKEMAMSLSSYWLSPGELVVGRRGEMGRCAVVPLEGKGWLCGTGSLLATPDPPQVLPDYLQLVVSSRASKDWLSLESVGSTMENLNGEILGRLPGFFPSISVQADRLSRAHVALHTHDELIKHVAEHIARLREYRSSLISAAVTGQLDVGAAEVAA
ncbi:restriction endonuclease subunit S [Polaromonas sp.]|uniref:restriction endonuclease subunit S n=1 Tax=Polaromonas sp. TaxID=1869339 RepID=UPI0025F102D7|nr:restriction endonuclease subunit S [Polaromonas sp.]